MLYIMCGPMEYGDGGIATIFQNHCKAEWFKDPFVQKMIQTIDHTSWLHDLTFKNLDLGVTTVEHLSNDVKVLIMLYEMPELPMWGSSCGDNCNGFIVEISKMHDIHLKYSHLPIGWPEKFDAIFEDNGEQTHTCDEFMHELNLRL